MEDRFLSLQGDVVDPSENNRGPKLVGYESRGVAAELSAAVPGP